MTTVAEGNTTNATGIEHVRELIGANGAGGWDKAWQVKATPWDRTALNPALAELIETKIDQVDGINFDKLSAGKALVAGCGRGHDAIYFATKGFDTLGIDLSSTAVEVAEKELASIANPPTNVKFEQHDFFLSSKLIPSSFSLAYDYTFLCAIPPVMYKDWAARYAALIKPDGILITLIFPIDGDRPNGPPYSVNEGIYSALLSPNFERMYFERPGASYPGHSEKQMMAIWKRKSE